MKDKKLFEALEQLYSELIRSTPATKQLEEKKEQLTAKIRESLDQDDLSAHHVSLNEVLDDAFESFEITHPKVAQLMNVCTNILNSMGI